MTTVSIQQARVRFQKVSGTLQDAMFSVQTSEIIQQVSEQNNITDDKISQIGKTAGLVLLGFIHPEDVSAELSEQMGISAQAAKTISDSLASRLFIPLKSELDKVYSPALHEDESGAPKIIQEIQPPKPAAMPIASAPKATMPSAPATPTVRPPSQVFSQTAQGFNVNAAPLASNKNVAAPAPSAPAPSTDKGWSKGMSQNPVIKLGVITPNASSPAQTPAATTPPLVSQSSPATTPAAPKPAAPAAPQTPAGQPQKGMSEFERLDMLKKGSATAKPSAPAAPQAPAGPAPVMLHEVSAAAQQSAPNFRFNQTAQNQISSMAPQKAAPAKAAVIEFANGSGPSAAKPAASTPPSGPTHYTAYQPPTAAADGAPRQVTEIKPPQQQVTAPPPPPPRPSVSPAPTTPSTDQPKKDKVIVQNFL